MSDWAARAIADEVALTRLVRAASVTRTANAHRHRDRTSSGILHRLIESTVRIACPTVRAVIVPRAGRHRFICYIAIESMIEGEAKAAAMAAFVADPFLKYAIVVDHDVDVTNDAAVLEAIACRVRADRDIFMVPYAKGSPLDPASYDPAGGSHLVTKMGIDATRKSNYPDEVHVPDADKLDLAAFIPNYAGRGRLRG